LTDLNYADFVQKLADLLARIAANDVLLEQINRNLPRGAQNLLGAVPVERELQPGFKQAGAQLTEMVRLPNWAYTGGYALAWPPLRASIMQPLHVAALRR
jgi:hypothetical protein